MTDTIDRPSEAQPEPDDRMGLQNRALKITVVVLAVVALVLGGVLLYNATDGDDDASVPDDIQQLLDDWDTATENSDIDAFRALVSDDFRRPEYYGEKDGVPYRGVVGADNIASYLRQEASFDIETIGEPIVRGDGPWYVSVAQDWNQPQIGTKYTTIYTFAIVDEDGTLKVDDAYWVGTLELIEDGS